MIKSMFSIGFRPFFLLCALIAAFNPLLWMLNYGGYLEIESIFSSAMAWHGHEMLFGFAAALTCGFLLTASSNWTGRPPIKGNKLIVLALLFIFERIVPFLGMGKMAALILMSMFSVLFMAYLIYMLRGNRNLLAITPLMLLFYLSKIAFLIGDFFDHETLYFYAKDYGLHALILLMVMISGRVIPMFSQRHLGYRLQIPPLVNKLAVLSVVLLLIPRGLLAAPFQGALLIFAILANGVRLYHWRPMKCMRYPMIGVLHMAILFLIIGFGLGLMELTDESFGMTLVPMHGITLGALGTFAIGMMVRVTKGHTGRDLAPTFWDKLLFHGIYLSTLLRISPALTSGEYLVEILFLSSFLWFASYFFFIIRYSSFLVLPRPDTK